MTIPNHLLTLLNEFGEAVCETPCEIEHYREFVTINVLKRQSITNGCSRFPYLSATEQVYRLVRYRVKSEYISEDIKIWVRDVRDYQRILTDRQCLIPKFLAMWQAAPESFVAPKDSDSLL